VLALAAFQRKELAERALRLEAEVAKLTIFEDAPAEHFEVCCEVDDSRTDPLDHFMGIECACGWTIFLTGPGCKDLARAYLDMHIAGDSRGAERVETPSQRVVCGNMRPGEGDEITCDLGIGHAESFHWNDAHKVWWPRTVSGKFTGTGAELMAELAACAPRSGAARPSIADAAGDCGGIFECARV
jgi:hypothetical protein